MDDKTTIRLLFEYGHFWNPLLPESNNVTVRDLQNLTMRDSVVQMAVASWQEWNREAVSDYTWQMHGREAIVDGEIGPGTLASLEIERCGCADYPNPDEATGSGSWLKCDPERQDVHSIRVNLNTSRAPAAVKAYLAEALEIVVAMYAEIGLAVRYILNGEPREAEIEKEWTPLPGATVAWNQFPQANTCNQTITGKHDTAWSPSSVKTWASTEGHETGHGVGLQHTRGGVMNPSITGATTWIGDPSYGTLARYFGGKPIDARPTTPEEPEPTKPTSVGLSGFIKTSGGQVIQADQISQINLSQSNVNIFEPW